jgi:predicted nucleic acid-binding protein
MTLYVDSSAFIKRYLADEPEHVNCIERMERDETWTTSRLTTVETPRALHITCMPQLAVDATMQFHDDLTETLLIEVDRTVLAFARDIAIETGAKTLDAIHLASAKLIEGNDSSFLTYDQRQSRAAEQIGLRLTR